MIFIGLILASPITSADECSVGKDFAVRLDEGVGSLAGTVTQDQDSLGMCYAESLTTILRANTPGRPDFSAITTALESLDIKPLKKGMAGPTGSSMLAKRYFGEGRLACAAFEVLSKKGYCRKDDVLLERVLAQGQDKNLQGRFLSALGNYFDSVRGDPDAKSLSELLPKLYSQASKNAETECSKPSNADLIGLLRKIAENHQKGIEKSERPDVVKVELKAARAEVKRLEKMARKSDSDENSKALAEAKTKLDGLESEARNYQSGNSRRTTNYINGQKKGFAQVSDPREPSGFTKAVTNEISEGYVDGMNADPTGASINTWLPQLFKKAGITPDIYNDSWGEHFSLNDVVKKELANDWFRRDPAALPSGAFA